MSLATATFGEVLDDLSSRFIINVPPEELVSVERICFQVEQAHWFYEDFIREQNPVLPSFSLKQFSAKNHWADEHEKAYGDFLTYKFRVPVCGAIILNEALDKCLLVKGWTSKAGWGFPRGKINKDEPYANCAAREVFEETGFDVTSLIDEDVFLERTIREQHIRLFIIVGIPETTHFNPQTRKEISKISWYRLVDLPTYRVKRDNGHPATAASMTPQSAAAAILSAGQGANSVNNRNRFYMVIPFVNDLRRWIERKRASGHDPSAVSLANRASASRRGSLLNSAAAMAAASATAQTQAQVAQLENEALLGDTFASHDTSEHSSSPSLRAAANRDARQREQAAAAAAASKQPATISKRATPILAAANPTSALLATLNNSINASTPAPVYPEQHDLSTPMTENPMHALLQLAGASPMLPVSSIQLSAPEHALAPVDSRDTASHALNPSELLLATLQGKLAPAPAPAHSHLPSSAADASLTNIAHYHSATSVQSTGPLPPQPSDSTSANASLALLNILRSQ